MQNSDNRVTIRDWNRIFNLKLCCILFLVSCSNPEPTLDIDEFFDDFRPGYNQMEFLSGTRLNSLAVISRSLEDSLQYSNFDEAGTSQLVVGKDTIPWDESGLFWINPETQVSLFINESLEESTAQSNWESLSKHVGFYAGIENGREGFYYMKLDSIHPSSLNATFKAGKKAIQIRKPLSFSVNDINDLTSQDIKEIKKANSDLREMLGMLVNILVPEKDRIYKPLNGRQLTEEERMFGFINFWTEVKYNFAFFDQVPNLDWDEVLREYLPKIQAAPSNMDYYRLLEEVCALLQDGHTNIYLPTELVMDIGKPAVDISVIDSTFYVTNMDTALTDFIPMGSILEKVEGLPIESYLKKKVRPYISSSTGHIRRKLEAYRLLEGDRSKAVTVSIRTPDNQSKEIELDRNPQSGQWVRANKPWKLSEYKRYGDISYMALNSFDTNKIVDAFETNLDSIENSKGIIIDLRANGGGNSSNGYNILRYLTDQPIITSKWRTREHKPAFKAWGSFVDPGNENLGSWDREALKSYQDDYWYESGPDTIAPHSEKNIILPTVILIGNNTASAAEDFLIAADPLDNFVTIGDYTFGSTGQPMFIRLPGGGKARICTKRDTYPDNREFVGFGIEPDIRIEENLDDLITEKDTVLDFALQFMEEKIQNQIN